MKKILLITGLIILSVIWLLAGKKEGGLVGPGFLQQITHSQPTSTSTPAATPNAPRTFHFDSSTDLKMELDKVNPQVLDSDFE